MSKEKFEQKSNPLSEGELEKIFLKTVDENFFNFPNRYIEITKFPELLTDLKDNLIEKNFNPNIEKFISFTSTRHRSFVKSVLDFSQEKSSSDEQIRLEESLLQLNTTSESKLIAALSKKYGFDKFIKHQSYKGIPEEVLKFIEEKRKGSSIGAMMSLAFKTTFELALKEVEDAIEIGYRLSWKQENASRWLTLSCHSHPLEDNNNWVSLCLYEPSPATINQCLIFPHGLDLCYIYPSGKSTTNFSEKEVKNQLTRAYNETKSQPEEKIIQINKLNFYGYGISEQVLTFVEDILFMEGQKNRNSSVSNSPQFIPVPVSTGLSRLELALQLGTQHMIRSGLDQINTNLNNLKK